MASGFGLRHALPATRARVVPQARTVLTRATIAEPVVVKREGTSHAMRPALIHLAGRERAVRENRKRDAEKRRRRAAPREVVSDADRAPRLHLDARANPSRVRRLLREQT